MKEEQLLREVLDEAFYIHSKLGPGLLENVYKQCLAHRLLLKGHFIEIEKPIAVGLDNLILPIGYRADLIVETKVIIETKSVEEIAPIHIAQVLTYLKFANLRHGLILNFNTLHLKNGIRRVLNGY